MKAMKVLLLLISSTMFVSCSENANIADPEIQFENPYEIVGVEHNVMLKQLLEETSNYSRDDAVRYVISSTKTEMKAKGLDNSININNYAKDYSVYKDPKTLFNHYKETLKGKGISSNSENNYVVSEAVDKEMNEVIHLLESQHWDLKSLFSLAEEREKNLPANLNEDEKLALYSMYATMKHSMTYWAPVSEGGEGGFESYNGSNIKGKVNWWKVGGVDVVGALVGGYSGGGGGAIVGGAGASAIAIIMQL